MGMTIFDNQIMDYIQQKMDEKDLDHILRLSMERMNRSGKLTSYKHHGFDFDQEAGHDKLVTDNLRNRLRNAIFN